MKGLMALILYHWNSYVIFGFTSFVPDIIPEPVFQVQFSKLETECRKNKKVVQDYGFCFKIRICILFAVYNPMLILNQLVELTPCQCKLDSRYL